MNNTTNFLEQLAKEAHYSPRITALTNAQLKQTQEALETNNAAFIQGYFPNIAYLAHGLIVAKI